MKIGTTNSNTLITNIPDQKRHKFSVQASGKMFTVLSDSLYQHKVKAVVREIGCNAYDAHIDANNTSQPFDVTLPCEADPFFRVRDYGIGLSEDRFVEVYTTYFGSTKSETNDHTGGLGLGSKTPFIMSKTFTVHSYYNGTEYVWNAFVNDNGEPDVVLLASQETDQPNGLLVSVPIGIGLSKNEQLALYNQFLNEATEVYSWFDVIPNVTHAGEAVEIDPALDAYKKIQLTGLDKTVVHYWDSGARTTQASIIRVKMGNVVYPYDLSKCDNLERFGGNITLTKKMIQYLTGSSVSAGLLNPSTKPIVIEVPMGAVDMAPSRESLSLNNATELTIINAIVRFFDMLHRELQAKVDAATTTAERYEILYGVMPLPGRAFKVNGEDFDPSNVVPAWVFDTKVSTRGLRQFVYGGNLMIKHRKSELRGINPVKHNLEVYMYGPNAKRTTVLLVDTQYKGELRNWVNANVPTANAVVVLMGINNATGLARPLTDAEMQPFLEDGNQRVVKFSSFKNTPVTAPRAKSKASLTRLSASVCYVMGRVNTSYNYFTTGNSQPTPLDKVVSEFKSGDAITSIVIAYERKNGEVYGDLQPGPNQPVVRECIAGWSRSTSTTSGWNDLCDAISNWLCAIPTKLGLSGLDVTGSDGITHTVSLKGIKHVVFTTDVYASLTSDPKLYPNVFTVDRAIKELIIPRITEASANGVVIKDGAWLPAVTDRPTSWNAKPTTIGGDWRVRHVLLSLGWLKTLEWLDGVRDSQVASEHLHAVDVIVNSRFASRGYKQLIPKRGVVEYRISREAVAAAIKEVSQTPVGEVLRAALGQLPQASMCELIRFTEVAGFGSSLSDRTTTILKLFTYMLETDRSGAYSAVEMDELFLKALKKHVVS